MNELEHQTLSPDDPRLTAYALGELDGAERATIEAAVLASPALQAAVADVRALAGDLKAALAAEEPLAAAPVAAVVPTVRQQERHKRPRLATVMRLPFSYYSIATLAAACFAVVVWMGRDDVERQHAQKQQAQSAAARAKTGPKSLAGTDVAAVDSPLEVTFTWPEPATIAESGVSPTIGQTRVAADAQPLSPSPLLGAAPGEIAAASPALDSSLLSADANAAPLPQELAPTRSSGERRRAALSFALPQASLVPESPAPLLEQVQQERVAAQAPPSDNAITLRSFSVGAPTGSASAPGKPAVTAGRRNGRVNVGQVVTFSSVGGNDPRARTREGAGARSMLAPAGANATGDTYAARTENRFISPKDQPLSTFAADVDTASYAQARRMLDEGRRPPLDAVRVEEWVNYFPYRYAPPARAGGAPFAAHLEVAGAPWKPEHRLVRIGIKGREIAEAARPAANLVFLLDVSGSMNAPNRLPLIKQSLDLLLQKLRPDDRVAIVTYAGQSGLALPSTPVSQRRTILEALEALHPQGSTNGGMGIHLAYDIAKANFIPGGTNRVILCTDGDFNVGVTGPGELTRLVEEKARSRVFLTVLGYGMGNFKDATLERLADRGNGNYGYIDTLREAQKFLVEQVGGTLVTIAKDVKLQVEFNPAHVAAYRLIGYENRLLAKEDFNNDTVDAGEIGAGHTVTALYEIIPAGTAWDGEAAGGAITVDALKYQRPTGASLAVVPASPDGDSANAERAGQATGAAGELLTVKIRYKAPEGDVSSKLEFPLTDPGATFDVASTDFQFAAAVAGFAMVLADSPLRGTATYDHIIGWAEQALADDAEGYRREFVGLVGKAKTMALE